MGLSRPGLLVLLALLALAPARAVPGGAAYHHLCTLIGLPWAVHTHVPAVEWPAVAADGGATFQVSYTGFTTEAQTAFQRAVDLWAGLVSSPRPIRIRASFASLGANVLGSAGATCFHADFPGATASNTWYPNPLADRLSNSDLDGAACGDSADAGFEIVAQFSSTANWYFGLDGATPATQYDFVSVVLHEIGHGLGFSGFANVTSGQGTVLASGRPGIYDRFTVSENGVSLATGFTNPSAELASQLTRAYNAAIPRGAGVYFSGPHTNASNGGVSARLYTPSTWNSGSSYSHLEDDVYPAGHADSLMTHAINRAEAIHHPGNVTLGMFKDMGWSTCPASLASTSTSVSGASSTGSVALSIEPGCVWTATSQSGFLTISSAASGTGSTTVSYAVAANTTGSSRQGTLRISGVTYTVTQSANSNTVTLSPASLRFAATQPTPGGPFGTVTPGQSVTVQFSGTPGSWSVSANQPWVSISGGSGGGNGVFTVSLASGVSAGSTTATITLTSAAAGNSPVQLPITVTVQNGASSAPIGQVDSPTQNATGVQGAIGVTGWALDDFGVTRVQIFRECLPFDAAASCQVVLGQNIVYVGDAAFLAGARPDVESAFSTYPQAHRGGWGYLMLTPMLPHVTNGQAYGGQGALRLYAIATDVEGNRKLLGRSSDPASAEFATATQITMANDSIAKPFGAIDTPGQGATVSGTFANFGWALTPDSNTVADGTDILIPTTGATMVVFIDGQAIAPVAYNQCRGNVGNPVPSTAYCNDDVASIFGHPTPQATFTPRTSNPTRYRNLDAGRAAIGAYDLNTTTLSNGLHSIAWSVTDSAGRTEGIGSRFFIVLNGGG